MNKNRALGKGLHSLLPQRDTPVQPVTELPTREIVPNPRQPRLSFQDEQLQELATSIRTDGVIQPLIVRRVEGKYELVAGERRLRAAKLVGLDTVPVVVRDIPDAELLEIALVENIQREDLNPMELATAFERMCVEMDLNHAEIGNRTGKDRATVANAIRLLQLPPDLQKLVAERKLSPGHARALLKLATEEEQRNAAQSAIAEGWSVREIEERTKPATSQASRKPRSPSEPTGPDPNVKAAIAELERLLGTRVRVFDNGKGKGRIEIEFYSQDDLDRIYSAITKTAE